MNRKIDNPRPLYEKIEPKKSARYERLEAGGGTGGIVLDITRRGLVINGYYKSFHDDETKYANTLKPVAITWEDLEKAKKRVEKPAKKVRKKAGIKPDKIEEKIDQEYLESLPIVTLNGKQYYIDGERRERRPVKSPEKVFKY